MPAASERNEGRSGFRGALRALAHRLRSRKTLRDDGVPAQRADGLPAQREISAKAAIENTRFTGKARAHPRAGDPRVAGGLLLPRVFPRFMLKPGSTVFTIGSCFAREIEERLPGFELPTRQFHLGPELVDGRPNSILNEYNAASMAQRIEWAIDGRDTAQIEGLVSGTRDKVTDLILSKGHPAAPETILGIRRQIDGVYSALPKADAVILTLGMTEVWRDNESGIYLNRLPSPRELKQGPALFLREYGGARGLCAYGEGDRGADRAGGKENLADRLARAARLDV